MKALLTPFQSLEAQPLFSLPLIEGPANSGHGAAQHRRQPALERVHLS